jgi:hypothetical protein
MTIYVPGVMFAAGISIYLFNEFNRVKEEKQSERRESLNDVRQQYLNQLIAVKRKEQEAAEDQPTTEPHEGASGSDDSNSL